jgi:hypothetical protein
MTVSGNVTVLGTISRVPASLAVLVTIAGVSGNVSVLVTIPESVCKCNCPCYNA